MPEHATPEIIPARTGWLVWIVPFIALLVGGYLLIREFSNRGPQITVTFIDGSGLEAGKTRLVYRGVVVGLVEAVELADDMEKVKVTARLDKSAAEMAREKTLIWVARPRISMSGVSGLETIMNGYHLEIQPGPGKPYYAFTGLEDSPNGVGKDAPHFILHTPHRGSIHEGVPVLFRGMEVGQVESVSLSSDATEILVGIAIEKRYHSLVREGTVFWDSGGVNMKLGLLGAKIRTGSLESVLTGAVALATPPKSEAAPLAPDGSHFELHPEARDEWLKWTSELILPDEDAAPDEAGSPAP